MENFEKIGKDYKTYRKNISNWSKPLRNSTLEQYWNDIKFVLDKVKTRIEIMYSNKNSFEKYMKDFEEYVNKNGLQKNTLTSYKSDCENFYKFWQKYNVKKTVKNKIYKRTNIVEFYEGELTERAFLSKKRNQQIVSLVKQRDNYKCLACKFHHNDEIVQAHHLIPIKDKQAGVVKEDELITLCPTCHALAHALLKTDDSYQNKDKLIKKLSDIVSKE